MDWPLIPPQEVSCHYDDEHILSIMWCCSRSCCSFLSDPSGTGWPQIMSYTNQYLLDQTWLILRPNVTLGCFGWIRLIDWLAALLSWSVGVFNLEPSISSCLRSRCELTEVAWRAAGMLCCRTGSWRCRLLMETVFSLTSIKSRKQQKCLTLVTLSFSLTLFQLQQFSLLKWTLTCFFPLPLSV